MPRKKEMRTKESPEVRRPASNSRERNNSHRRKVWSLLLAKKEPLALKEEEQPLETRTASLRQKKEKKKKMKTEKEESPRKTKGTEIGNSEANAEKKKMPEAPNRIAARR